jgi:hypothetical protein
MCLLSAKDIVANFKINNNGSYRLLTDKIISKFLIVDRSRSLDYIENSIQCAEFYKNRIYVFNELNSVEPDFDAIHPDYKMDIDYIDGNIPDIFKEQKLKAYDFILEIEKIHSQLLKFVQEIDPVESSYIAELFNHYNRDVIRIPQIFDKDFYYKAQKYLELINHLKDDGVLETYLSLKKNIRNEIDNFLSSNIFNVNLTSQQIISIKYDLVDLSGMNVQNEIIPTKGYYDKKYFSYLVLKEGEIKMSINIDYM